MVFPSMQSYTAFKILQETYSGQKLSPSVDGFTRLHGVCVCACACVACMCVMHTNIYIYIYIPCITHMFAATV